MSEKRTVRVQPKILSKVITRFESKLGAGRPDLRRTMPQGGVRLGASQRDNSEGGTSLTIRGLSSRIWWFRVESFNRLEM